MPVHRRPPRRLPAHLGAGQRTINSDLLDVARPDDGPPPNGTRDTGSVAEIMHEWSARTFNEPECSSARAIADLTWAASRSSAPSIDDLAQFGRDMTNWARTHPQVGVSMYDLDTFGGALIPAMVSTHLTVWVCGLTIETPYADAAAAC
jgi:hypothetical protein